MNDMEKLELEKKIYKIIILVFLITTLIICFAESIFLGIMITCVVLALWGLILFAP